jgi:hypothetical protein
MDANREKPSGQDAPEAPREKLPSFGTRLMAVFVEPKVVFDYVAKRTDIWLPFIALAVMAMAAAALALPASTKGQALIASVTGRAAPGLNTTAYVKALVTAPINLMVGILVIAFFVWLIMTFTSGSAPFSRAMSVAAWSLFPATLGALLNGIVVSVAQPEIRSIQTFVVDQSPVLHYTSLGALTTGTGPILSMILLTISVFYFWQLWLLFIGARRSFGATVAGAWTLVVALLVLQLAFAAFGGWGISMLLKM